MDSEGSSGAGGLGPRAERPVVVGEIILVGSTRDELAHLDRGPTGLGPVNRDPIVEAEIHSLSLSISDKLDAMDREAEAKYGPLPKYEIPKCKGGGGCELAWAFKVHLGTLRDRDRDQNRGRTIRSRTR